MKLDSLAREAGTPTYFDRYIDLVRDVPIKQVLRRQLEEAMPLAGLDEGTAGALHAPYTWTIRRALGHVIDGERIFCYRLLCIARGETQSLPGWDEHAYADASNADELKMAALVEEFGLVRRATMALIANLPDSAAQRTGVANQVTISCGTLAYVLAGHAEHHLRIIRRRIEGR
jgi:hypothetical protein